MRRHQGLLVRLDRRRDVGAVALQHPRLPAAAQALDPGHLPRRPRPQAARPLPLLPRARPLQLALAAPLHLQRLPLRPLPHSRRPGLRLRLLPRRHRQPLPLLHRRRQVVQRHPLRRHQVSFIVRAIRDRESRMTSFNVVFCRIE